MEAYPTPDEPTESAAPEGSLSNEPQTGDIPAPVEELLHEYPARVGRTGRTRLQVIDEVTLIRSGRMSRLEAAIMAKRKQRYQPPQRYTG